MRILDEINWLRCRHMGIGAHEPNRLEIPKERLQEFTDALHVYTMYEEETGKPIESKPGQSLSEILNLKEEPNQEWKRLTYKGMDVTIGSKLQVWRVEKTTAPHELK